MIHAAGSARRRRQRVAEGARRAGEDERHTPASRAASSRFSVPVMLVSTKSRARMGRDMRLVQRRGVQHGVDALHACPDEVAIGDRPGALRERTGIHIDGNDISVSRPQNANECITEMPGTARDQIFHAPDLR